MKVEAKKHELRSARKPQDGFQLSGVVSVYAEESKGVAYIRFSEAFIESVGKKMPRGISPDDPCYLLLEYNTVTKSWALSAHYLYERTKVLLKVYRELPEWVKVKGRKNGKKAA